MVPYLNQGQEEGSRSSVPGYAQKSKERLWKPELEREVTIWEPQAPSHFLPKFGSEDALDAVIRFRF